MIIDQCWHALLTFVKREVTEYKEATELSNSDVATPGHTRAFAQASVYFAQASQNVWLTKPYAHRGNNYHYYYYHYYYYYY